MGTTFYGRHWQTLKQPEKRMLCKPHRLRSSSRTGDALLGDERTEDGVTSDISSREGCLGGQGFVASQSRTVTNQCKQGESVFLRTCCMRWHEQRRSLSQRIWEVLSVLPLDIDHVCWQVLLWSAGFCGICPWQWAWPAWAASPHSLCLKLPVLVIVVNAWEWRL